MAHPQTLCTSLILILFLCIIQSSWKTTNAQGKTEQDAFNALGISWNPNGTLTRQIWIPMVGASYDEDATPKPTALSTDIQLTSKSDAFVRLYRPVNLPTGNKKLPIIVYFHGGDFVLFSATTIIFHNFCNDIASKLPAIVVSVEYRLAPENRLPAAYDDGINALNWVRDQAIGKGGRDPWMEYGDFSRVHLLGSSAGANIAYHVALRALDFNYSPLKIKGLLMNQGFFGGLQRTQSEIKLKDDAYVALYIADVLWTLALPKNLNRDHEFCNPISGGTYQGRVLRLPKVYIKGDYGDPLVDRSVTLAQFLISFKVPMYYRFNQGGFHGIELQNTTAAAQLYNDIKYFVDDDLKVNEDRISSEPLYYDMNNLVSAQGTSQQASS